MANGPRGVGGFIMWRVARIARIFRQGPKIAHVVVFPATVAAAAEIMHQPFRRTLGTDPTFARRRCCSTAVSSVRLNLVGFGCCRTVAILDRPDDFSCRASYFVKSG